MRKTIFANDEYYHIYNRGVDKREVFSDDADFHRFIMAMILVNDEHDGLMEQWRNIPKENVEIQFSDFRRLNLRKPLVDIVAYCLNPNHYHLIGRQEEEGGIKKFMQRLGTAYTMYFYKKNRRSGSLFQGTYKAIHVDSNEYLLYLSAYVNRNHFIHGLGRVWKYSSESEYDRDDLGALHVCDADPVLGQFRNTKEYREFLERKSGYLRERKEDRKYLLEDRS